MRRSSRTLVGGHEGKPLPPLPTSVSTEMSRASACAEILRARVLIVDDNEGVSAAWRDALAKRGHLATCLSDGLEAQRAIFGAPFQYDLILCDLDLPGMPGMELLESILPLVKDRTPVVVVTAFPYMIDALGELQKGAFSVLPKPNDLGDFYATVEKALEQRKLYLRLRALEVERSELIHKTNVLLAQNEELSKRVRVDALTKTANRVRLFEDLRALDSNRYRYGAQFALAIVDIDDFGRFNKRHGIEVGDAVLRRVAAALLDACRSGDVVYRFGAYATETTYRLGGDEFVLVLAAQDVPTATQAVDRIREHVKEVMTHKLDDLPADPVTISAGVVADEAVPPRSIEEMLREANVRLKAAKRAGGDCVRGRPDETSETER